MASDATAIGRRIREARQQVGLSQRDLASVGMSYSYISRVEVGQRRPSIRALRLLAPRLRVSAHWLETGKPDPADELARLVLDQPEATLPPRARTLARRILNEDR